MKRRIGDRLRNIFRTVYMVVAGAKSYRHKAGSGNVSQFVRSKMLRSICEALSYSATSCLQPVARPCTTFSVSLYRIHSYFKYILKNYEKYFTSISFIFFTFSAHSYLFHRRMALNIKVYTLWLVADLQSASYDHDHDIKAEYTQAIFYGGISLWPYSCLYCSQ